MNKFNNNIVSLENVVVKNNFIAEREGNDTIVIFGKARIWVVKIRYINQSI